MSIDLATTLLARLSIDLACKTVDQPARLSINLASKNVDRPCLLTLLASKVDLQARSIDLACKKVKARASKVDLSIHILASKVDLNLKDRC